MNYVSTETARAEAFAAQADKSREQAGGYLQQSLAVAKGIREIKSELDQQLRAISIPFRWAGSRLELQNAAGEWVSGPDLTGPGVVGAHVDEAGHLIIELTGGIEEDAGSVLGPRGFKGDAGTIAIGTVSTAPYGTSPTVVNVGTPDSAVLNFALPEGAPGQGQVISVSANTDGALGLSVSGAPITTTGTLTFNWQAGYQGYTTVEANKLSQIAVTQSVDLDAIEARVHALDAAVVIRGSWSAAGGVFPGAGAAQAGEAWIVSADGTVGGVVFNIGDRVIAITDNASTTVFAGNWFKEDYTDAVSSVDGKVGLIAVGDILATVSSKAAPVDADKLALSDSASGNATKHLTWANLKAGIWSALGALISGGAAKAAPVDADSFALSDSAASNATKKLSWANIKAALKAHFEANLSTFAGLTPTNGYVVTGNGSSFIMAAPAGGLPTLIARDEKSAGSGGGSNFAGSWQGRTINTLAFNSIAGSSLVSSDIILPVGSYEVDASCPVGGGVYRHKARLRNVTDNVVLVDGTSETAEDASPVTTNRSFVKGYFTLTDTKTIRLEHYMSSATATGLGPAVNAGAGIPEIYSIIVLRKVA